MEDPPNTHTVSTPSSSIDITRRNDLTAYMHCLHIVLRKFNSRVMASTIQTHPEGSISIELSPPSILKNSFNIIPRKLAGIWVYGINPRKGCKAPQGGASPDRKHIYYIAGGSWQQKPGRQHWQCMARWAATLQNTRVSLVSMPLAPEYPAPKAFDKIMELYRQVMEGAATEGPGRDGVGGAERVIWAGDSSGANIALCMTAEGLRRYPDLGAPAAVMAICPSTDLTRSNPAIKEIDKKDPLLSYDLVINTARIWAGDWNKDDPRISPLFADLTPLLQNNVEVHGVTAGYDVLGPDGIKFREKLEKAGVSGKWLEWERQMHCFPLTWMYHIREGKESFEWITKVLAEA